MQWIDEIPVWGQPDQGAVRQIKRVRDCGAARVALMADHHLGYSQPIGGVAGYREALSPSGVGYDIACGNKAVRLEGDRCALLPPERLGFVMDRIWSEISFGIGRKNKEPVEHELFDDDPAWEIPFVRSLKDLAYSQLGTVGSGNHYVDLFADDHDRVWIGVHFGSRGFGHKIATEYIRRAGGKEGMDVAPAILAAGAADFEEYKRAMRLAGRYAYAGRDWVCNRVAQILGAEIVEAVHNHHNFAWREEHFGEDLWVVRKGATPSAPGQKSFVGATMAEPSVILEGVDSEETRQTLRSTVHGAGRVMSRTKAAGKFKWVHNPKWVDGGSEPRRIKARVREGVISDAERLGAVTEAGVILRGGGNDEAPRAYKRLDEVLIAHQESVRILHRLTPIGVAMAASDEFDPYRD
jgi:tRNA-splicing ligase RtcB